jgi:hypothetical protein
LANGDPRQDSSVAHALGGLLSHPSPESVWRLRAALSESGAAADGLVFHVLAAFHSFLAQLVSRSTAREYSHFASMLDLGAIAGVAVQNLIESEESEKLWARLSLGFMSEGLMVLAARQYVRAWEEEMRATYLEAAWVLYDFYWALSVSVQTELESVQRRVLVEQLLRPLRDEQTPGMMTAVATVFLFQILALALLSGE